jgi:hypothetical protein
MVAIVDATGNLHVFGSTDHRGEGIVHLTNAGGTWNDDQLTQPPEEGTDGLGWAAVDTDGSLWFSYIRWSFYNPCGFVCPRPHSRYDGQYLINNVGGSWSEPLRLPDSVGQGALLAVHDGVLHAAFGTFDRARQETSLYYATNPSNQWAIHDMGSGNPSGIKVASDGTPWIAYGGDLGGAFLASIQGNEVTAAAIPGVLDTDGGIDALLIDPLDRPVVIFDRWEERHGYRAYAVRRDGLEWSPQELVANRYVDDAAFGPSGALHVVYHLFEMEKFSDEGLWYASLSNGASDSRHLDDSARFAYDAPSPPQVITVDQLGRPHVFFSTPYDEGEEGLWYVAGPPL